MDIERLTALMGSDMDGRLFTYDCLRIEGVTWLVPAWRVHRAEGWQTPVRMIRVDPWMIQQAPALGHDVWLHALPTDVLEGRTVSHAGVRYEVREDDIRIPSARPGH